MNSTSPPRAQLIKGSEGPHSEGGAVVCRRPKAGPLRPNRRRAHAPSARMSAVKLNMRRRGLLGAAAGAPLLMGAARSSEGSGGGRLPQGYADVDPRTARRVPLWQTLSPQDPLFPGDPKFTYRIANTIPEDGYLLEQITSLGTHTGTHISAPCHFHVGAPCLVRLPERFFTPRPLVVLDVRAAIRRHGDGDFFVAISDLRRFERAHGGIPPGSYVVLYTGLSRFYHLGNARRPGP